MSSSSGSPDSPASGPVYPDLPPLVEPQFTPSPYADAVLFEPGPKSTVIAQLIWFGLWLITTGIGLVLKPSVHGHGTHQQLGLAPCPSVLLFGRPCPGCGLTTSWTALVHGDLKTSFAAHPLGPFLYAGFTAVAFAAVYCAFKGFRIKSEGVGLNRVIVVAAIIFFGFGIWRFATHPNYASPHEQVIRQFRK